MIRLINLCLLGIILLSACAAPVSDQQVSNLEQASVITVFKSSSCGCCNNWSEYLEQNGFTLLVKEVQDLVDVKDNYQVPAKLRSCHTAIVNGYVIEGHVPEPEIMRLLDELPHIIGLAVPGMPPGSPGMEVGGSVSGTFDIIAFDWSGNTEVFASYPK